MSDPKDDHELVGEVLETLMDMDGVTLQGFDTEGGAGVWTTLDVSVAIAPEDAEED